MKYQSYHHGAYGVGMLSNPSVMLLLLLPQQLKTNNKDENKRGRYLSPVMGAMDRGE